MGLSTWVRKLVSQPLWEKGWEALDREYRAGRISVNQYQAWKEQLVNRRTNWPCPEELKK